MKFDPTKPHMAIHGQDPSFPGARYQQGPFVYDTHHRIISGVDPNAGMTPAQVAKQEVVEKLAKELQILTDKLKEAQSKYNADQTTQTKASLTKATNKYEAAREELSEIAS